MKKLIVIHCTCTPDDRLLTTDEVMDLFSQEKNQDPMPFHYIIDLKGRVVKTKKDNELCGHCGKWSRGSLSIAFMGGVSSIDGSCGNTMNEQQEASLIFLLKEYQKRYDELEIKGCNEILHRTFSPEIHEPFFNVSDWLTKNNLQAKANG